MWFLLMVMWGWMGVGPQTAEDTALQLETRLRALKSLQADFQQTYHSINVSTPLQEKGRLHILRPGWMRFDYFDPEVKVFLIKDDLYQEYWPEDKQLVERTLAEEGSEGALLSLLSGTRGILDNYSVEFDLDADGEISAARLKITPRNEDEADTFIILELDDRTGLIRKAVSFDWTGNRQEFEFSGIKADIPLPESLFELKIPPDVDIIR